MPFPKDSRLIACRFQHFRKKRFFRIYGTVEPYRRRAVAEQLPMFFAAFRQTSGHDSIPGGSADGEVQ